MTRRRGVHVLRAAGSLLVLLALLVGVPVALAAVAGWPLPTAWPNGDQLRFAARGGLGDGVWIKVFSVVVWLAWAQLAVAVLQELLAAVRHRTGPSRSGWAAVVARRLVGALVVSSGALSYVPQALPFAEAAARPVTVPAATTITASVAALAAPPVLPAPHVVVRGETLSSIADDELGTPAAWPFLWETNRGRSFGTRVFDDPNLILPGWELAVPGPARTEPVVPEPVVPDPAMPEPVAPTLIPPVVIAAPVQTADAKQTIEHAEVVGADVDVDVDAEEPDRSSSTPAWARFTAFTGAALLATGAVAMLRSSRRRVLRPMTRAVTVAGPEGEQADAVTALVAGSDAVGLARLELALRALAGRLGRSGSEARVLAVRRGSDGLQVALDRPAVLDDPWRPDDDGGRTWLLAASVTLRELIDDARAVAPPCPALIGLGRDDSGAEIFVDLEAAGIVDVGATGSGPEAARHIAATLAVTPLADELRVVTVGAVLPELAARHEVRSLPDLPAAVADVESMTAPIVAATAGHRSTFCLRAIAGHEPWEPVVVILRDPPPPGDPGWDALTALAAAHRGVAVVGSGLPTVPGAVVPADDGTLSVAGWTVRPHGLDGAEAKLLVEVIELDEDVAHDVNDVDDVDPTTDVEPWALMVRVLGPVDVVARDGSAAEFDRAKALELVVWLAQHRHTATRTGARSALWESDLSNASFSNVVSDARRALARVALPPEGEEWLGRTYAERLPLHAQVVLDADVVRAHLARARHAPDDEAIDELRRALSLVRGAPYSGRCYLWPDAEALPSTLTLLVTTVAVELGRRLLDRDDVDGVLEATATGLEVLPGHEELVGLRLRAHAARGDRAALRHEYACYEQSLLADPWAGDPSPALAALRRELVEPVQQG